MKTFYFTYDHARKAADPHATLDGVIEADALEAAQELLWQWVQEKAREDSTGYEDVVSVLDTKPAGVKLWLCLPEETIRDDANWDWDS